MREIMKKTIVLILVLIMILGLSVTSAWATGTISKTEYDVTKSVILNGDTFDLTITVHGTEAFNVGDTVQFQTPVLNSNALTSYTLTSNDLSSENKIAKVRFSAVTYTGTIANTKLEYTIGSLSGGIVDIEECMTDEEYHAYLVERAEAAATNAQASASKAEGYAQQSIPDTKVTTYPAPRVIFSRNDLPELKAEDKFEVVINVKNKSNYFQTLQNPIATVDVSEELMLLDSQNVFELSNIAANSSASIKVTLKALKTITNPSQYISVALEYDYKAASDNTIEKVTSSGKVTVPLTVTEAEKEEETDGPVPNLIVRNFDFGGSSVAAGSEFTFGLKFKNTNEIVDCENVIVTVDSVGFTPNGAANSFYFKKVEAGDTKTITLPMKAASTFVETTEPITISFSYEYVQNKKRMTMQSSSKVSVPVYQKDRFEIQNPVVPGVCYAGEEISVTMSYVNKGKASANNVATELSGDISSPSMTQNLGNIAAGASGQFAFAVTPNSVGECTFEIIVSYEDADENLKERVFPVTLNVEEMVWDDPGYIDEPIDEPVKSNKWIYFAIGAVVLIVGTIIAVKKIKKKKAKKVDDSQWKAWEEEFAKEDQKTQEKYENK